MFGDDNVSVCKSCFHDLLVSLGLLLGQGLLDVASLGRLVRTAAALLALLLGILLLAVEVLVWPVRLYLNIHQLTGL